MVPQEMGCKGVDWIQLTMYDPLLGQGWPAKEVPASQRSLCPMRLHAIELPHWRSRENIILVCIDLGPNTINPTSSLNYIRYRSSKKVKLSRYHHTDAKGERRYSFYSILTSAIDGKSGQPHAPATLYPGERTTGTHWTGGWVGPRAGLDKVGRGKILCLCRGSNHGRQVRSQTIYRLSYFTSQGGGDLSQKIVLDIKQPRDF
jgi:hypothetical protein